MTALTSPVSICLDYSMNRSFKSLLPTPIGCVTLEWHNKPGPRLKALKLPGLAPPQVTKPLPAPLQALEDIILERLLHSDRLPHDELLDWSGISPFRYTVIHALLTIPRGEVITYGELAQRTGHPGAARAVGGAMAANPFPLLYPCHRVVARGAKLGGFGGGAALKKRLLHLEGMDDYS